MYASWTPRFWPKRFWNADLHRRSTWPCPPSGARRRRRRSDRARWARRDDRARWRCEGRAGGSCGRRRGRGWRPCRAPAPLDAEAADVLVGRRVVGVEDRDVRRQRDRTDAAAADPDSPGAIVAWIVEPARLEERGEQRRVQHDLVVVDAEAASDRGLPVAASGPTRSECGARSSASRAWCRPGPRSPSAARRSASGCAGPATGPGRTSATMLFERSMKGLPVAVDVDDGMRQRVVRVVRASVADELEQAVEVLRHERVDVDVVVVARRP